MKKRIIAMALSFTMIFSMLACGKEQPGTEDTALSSNGRTGTETEGNTQADPLTYTAAAVLHVSTYDLEDTLPMQMLQEQFNIDIQFQSILPSELDEKRNLLLNSGEYPELFIKCAMSNSEMYDYGSQGILLALEDLIREYMPNLTAWLDENNTWQWIMSSDGHVYGLPCYELAITDWNPYWVNMRWIENLGMKEPTNLEELYEVLKAFKDQDANGNGDPNDEIPMAFNGMPNFMMQYMGRAVDSRTNCYVEDGKLVFAPVSDMYYNYLEFMAKLYAEGLVLDTCFTITGEELAAKGTENDIIGSTATGGVFLIVGREKDDDYRMLTPFAEGEYSIGNGIGTGVLCVTDKCENPGPVLAMFDTFYSQEGGVLATMGVEGKTFVFNDEGQWEWIIGNGFGDNVDEVRARGTIQGTVAGPYIAPDIWWTGMSPAADPDEVYLNQERVRTAAYGVSVLPNMYYSAEDEDTLASLSTDITMYFEEYTMEVITGKKDLAASWDAYIETVEKMGLPEMMDIYQRTYDKSITMQ